jgi:hypothetical protein
MNTSKTKGTSSAPPPKGKAKLKSLKLRKETVQNLSGHDAEAVRGGASGSGGTIRTWSCDGG